MNVIRKDDAPVFELPGLVVTGLASPKRGAAETSVWWIAMAPRTPGVPHSVTREEIFVGVRGCAVVTIDGADHSVGPGDALIVPANTLFSLANRSDEPFEAIVTLPVGGQAVTADRTFTPPWAE